jgi:glycosyltransferase involved in cell wall biosynthesis
MSDKHVVPVKRIAHLTSVHPPFDVRVFHKECRTLAGAGYDVVLIAPHDRSQVVEGVRIWALPKPQGRRERMSRTVRDLYRAAIAADADVYQFHDPELIPVGVLLKLRGKRVVYDVHEDVPRQILDKQWIAPSARHIVSRGAALIEMIGVRWFDAIVAATPSIGQRFPRHRTYVVRNFPILGELVASEFESYVERSPTAAYVGVITENRGLGEMVQCMALLPQRLQARLVLAGRFSPPALEQEARSLPGWTHVDFVGWQSRSQVAALLGQARVGLVLFHPAPNHINAQPNKLFECMSAGLPVIASDFPLWREIVGSADCGLLVDPQRPQAIAQALQWLLEHPLQAEAMGQRGKQAVIERYNWDLEAPKLVGLYGQLLGGL